MTTTAFNELSLTTCTLNPVDVKKEKKFEGTKRERERERERERMEWEGKKREWKRREEIRGGKRY